MSKLLKMKKILEDLKWQIMVDGI